MNSIKSKLTATTVIALLPFSTAFLAMGQTTMEDSLPEPKVIIVDKSLSNNQVEKSICATRLFYAFWNTGYRKFATLALATNFKDRTLPKVRPQGAGGPLFASHNFRQAVPDLRCEI